MKVTHPLQEGFSKDITLNDKVSALTWQLLNLTLNNLFNTVVAFISPPIRAIRSLGEIIENVYDAETANYDAELVAGSWSFSNSL